MVVGSTTNGALRGWVWTQAAGIRVLESGIPGDLNTQAYGMSRDGRFIVGSVGLHSAGALWTEDGLFNLGRSPRGGIFQAIGVDAAGSIVIGQSNTGESAFVWTHTHGTEYLADYLLRYGVGLPPGFVFGASSISADGRTFAGSGFTPGGRHFGYVVTIPCPPSVIVASTVVCMGMRRRKRN
jgi:hypothetical protein